MSNTTPKPVTMFDPIIDGRRRDVSATEVEKWKKAGWKDQNPHAETTDPTDKQDEDHTLPTGNGSREEWATYASTVGIAVTDEMKRDDIKSAVEALA